MSPLEAAKKLAGIETWYGLGGDGYCIACDEYIGTSNGSHAPDCPTLAMPRIVAALEAAERVTDHADPFSEPTHYEDNPTERSTYVFCARDTRDGHAVDCPWQALVAALRGEGVPA